MTSARAAPMAGELLEAVARALRPHPRVVLAVSGGRDSMVMLHAALAAAPECIAAVATYDHGTGAAAKAAADLVERTASAAGLRVARGCSERELRGEVQWREARWQFLRTIVEQVGEGGGGAARVATAHTRDDQIETVLMRVLRGAGARGLAALYVEGDIVRPLLNVTRAEAAAYARRHGVGWVDDPSNQSRGYLRNRVRLDLLPALVRVRPQLPAELLALSRQAAEWRVAVDRMVEREVEVRIEADELRVARAELLHYDARGLAVVWPALAARVGVTLDRRGTRRLAMFTSEGASGGRIQLAGGYEVVLHRGWFRLRRQRGHGFTDAQLLSDGLAVGSWRFRQVRDVSGAGPWAAMLPAERPLLVRAWRPGDRMIPEHSRTARRVKGLLRDAGIDAPARVGWPVVVSGEEIVWVPGVRRSAAATVWSGRPVVPFACERLDR